LAVVITTHLFADADINVREAAVEVYIRRVYRAHRIKNMSVSEAGEQLICNFVFQFSDVEASLAMDRQGHTCVLFLLSTTLELLCLAFLTTSPLPLVIKPRLVEARSTYFTLLLQAPETGISKQSKLTLLRRRPS
jgi:hypothetical protein